MGRFARHLFLLLALERVPRTSHSRARSRRRAARCAVALALALFATNASAARPEPLEPIVAGLARSLPPEAARALAKIRGTDRKLLAARSYLKVGPELAARWSWSAAQIRAYEKSPEYRETSAEIAKVTAAFEAANPGYTLYVNRTVRSLDAQVHKWNASRSVGATAAELAAALRADLALLPPDADRAARIARAHAFVIEWFSEEFPPALAAPGLSAHGQGRAFDFQVQRGAHIVAGPHTGSATQQWDEAGWTEKLRAAIASASSRFEGPLAMPYEPWHYSYRPEPEDLP